MYRRQGLRTFRRREIAYGIPNDPGPPQVQIHAACSRQIIPGLGLRQGWSATASSRVPRRARHRLGRHRDACRRQPADPPPESSRVPWVDRHRPARHRDPRRRRVAGMDDVAGCRRDSRPGCACPVRAALAFRSAGATINARAFRAVFRSAIWLAWLIEAASADPGSPSSLGEPGHRPGLGLSSLLEAELCRNCIA